MLELLNVPEPVADKVRAVLADTATWTGEELSISWLSLDDAQGEAWDTAWDATWGATVNANRLMARDEMRSSVCDEAVDAVLATLVSDLLPEETLAPLMAGYNAVQAHRAQKEMK